ncbi:MAG: hypothetical protein GXO94_07370 [Nitrospirae bacterium]|nr:hypothetical protein [Nitrospirota bacterium]
MMESSMSGRVLLLLLMSLVLTHVMPVRADAGRLAAGDSGDVRTLRNRYLDTFEQYSASVVDLISERRYQQASNALEEWSKSLEQAGTVLNERQRLFSYSRLQTMWGYLWESKGLAAYFLDGDYINAPRFFEKARIHHERAKKLLSRVRFPEGAPAQAFEMQRKMVAMMDAEAERVRGMKLLVEGDYESETANFTRGIRLLEEAARTLEEAQARYPEGVQGSDAVAAVLGEGRRSLNFIDFTKALLHRARSDRALFQGDLLTAADEQKNRAEALERSRTMHLRADDPLHEGFAKRLTRDIHISYKRQDNLLAQAEKQSKWAWVWALGFFVLAIGSVVLFVWLSERFELVRNRMVFALLLLFVIAVAGIGARQVKWKDAAIWFKGALSTVLGQEKQ